MPLDLSLFSDLIEMVAKFVLSTSALEDGEKYEISTPNRAWWTMCDSWELVKSQRIVNNIDHFTIALDAIFAADGTYVSDFNLRNGHRKVMKRLVRGEH